MLNSVRIRVLTRSVKGICGITAGARRRLGLSLGKSLYILRRSRVFCQGYYLI